MEAGAAEREREIRSHFITVWIVEEEGERGREGGSVLKAVVYKVPKSHT